MKLSRKLIVSLQNRNVIIVGITLFLFWMTFTVLFGTNVRDFLFPVFEFTFIIGMLLFNLKKFNRVAEYIVTNEKAINEKYQMKTSFLINYYFPAFDNSDIEKLSKSVVGEDFIDCMKFYKRFKIYYILISLKKYKHNIL